MRILFVLKGLPLLRHFEEVVDRLAADGHTILLAPTKTAPDDALPEMLARHPRCRLVEALDRRGDGFRMAAGGLRQARDYLRYHEPALQGATANRRRALARLVNSMSVDGHRLPDDAADVVWPLDAGTADRVRKVFRQLESFVPVDPAHIRSLRTHRPDLLLITPLVTFGGRQADYVKAARSLGIPSALLVFSWDNLSNKGVMHEIPDRVFVWNEIQRREAIELHGVDAEAVIATGAPRFDPFFRLSPSQDRAAFCKAHDLDPARALVVYLASSPAVTPNEPVFVEAWIAALRQAPVPAVRDAQLLIRPHPRLKDVWKSHPRFGAAWRKDAEPDPGVAVMVSKSVQTDQSLYDALAHADATVGLNTTAELEAAILGTPVYTVRAPDAAPGQTGSRHFHYLLATQGGFVHDAGNLDQHVEQLADGLAGAADAERPRAFIQQFVLPRGADTPASGVLADEIESFAREEVRPSWRRWAAKPRDLLAELTRRARPPRPPARPTASGGRAPRAVEPPPSTDTPRTKKKKNVAAGPAGAEKRRVVYEPHTLHILVSTDAEQKWRLDPAKKEPWTVAWLDAQVGSGDVLYDIGANVGVFSLIGAANLGDRGTVVAFEPGYNSFARLCENIQLNRFSGRIIPVPLPLSDTAGVQRFRYHSVEPGQSQHRFDTARWTPDGADAPAKGTCQPMLAAPLDLVVTEFGLPRPTLMKIAVDGVEDRLLRGATAVLRDPGLRSVLIEIDPECEAGVLAALDEAGLRLVERFQRKKDQRVWYGAFGR